MHYFFGTQILIINWLETNSTAFLEHRVGALAKYRCERGYKVVGDPLVTCEETGIWSGVVPECICKYNSMNEMTII